MDAGQLKDHETKSELKMGGREMSAQLDGQSRSPVLVAAVTCLGTIGLFVAVDLLFFANGASFKREGGGIELVSAFLYVVAVVVFFQSTPRAHWKRLFHVPALMALFAMREMDFDKAFTQAGVLSSKLYTSDASVLTKVIAGSFALLAVWVLIRTVLKGGPAVMRGLKGGKLWAFFAVFAAVLIVFTKSIDGLGRKLADFGITISAQTDVLAALIEEVGEAFIPVCAILAIVACWKGTRA